MKSYMRYILSKFAIIILMPELIFVCELKWAKSQTKSQKGLKDDLSGRVGDLGLVVRRPIST